VAQQEGLLTLTKAGDIGIDIYSVGRLAIIANYFAALAPECLVYCDIGLGRDVDVAVALDTSAFTLLRPTPHFLLVPSSLYQT
jgi:hypothetical protein